MSCLQPAKVGRIFFASIAVIIFSFLFSSCQKEVSRQGFVPDAIVPNFTTKVTSALVSGFVTDESENPVTNAVVRVGTVTTTTDKFGYFKARNVEVTQMAALVTVTKAGYFKAFKTYVANEGKTAFFRVKLIPANTAGSFEASAGGTVTVNDLSVKIPAGSIVTAGGGAPYTGLVSVAAKWLNPVAEDLDRIMPGDLRGIDNNGNMKGLTTFGMAAVELTGSNGELLQIAPGKKATLTIPLPSAVSTSAPASIPLWHFDETNGLWKQEGSAAKTGNSYVGEVSHFSYWNCDLPNAIVPLSFTVKDAAGNPLANMHVEITPLTSNSWSHIGGSTDASGFVNVFVTPNATFSLSISSDWTQQCAYFSQNFTVENAAVALGDIIIPTSSATVVTGNAVNCSNSGVTSGYVILSSDRFYDRVELASDGTFRFVKLLCSGNNIQTQIFAVDNSSFQQSETKSIILSTGTNDAGTLNACGIATQQFIHYSVNGDNYAIDVTADPASSYVQGYVYDAPNQVPYYGISGWSPSQNGLGNLVSISFEQPGIALNSTQKLLSFFNPIIGDSLNMPTMVAPIDVKITEYGAIGEYIAGNFTGNFTGAPPANIPYSIYCSFRLKRYQ